MTEGSNRDVFARALALSAEDRAALADLLDLGPEWKAEISRRIAAVERGESRLIPANEVEARVLESLGRI